MVTRQTPKEGKVFTRLTFIKIDGLLGEGRAALCRCACGTIKRVRVTSLFSGNTRSCGCLNRESASTRMVKLNRTHGESKTRFYKIYASASNRCNNKNNKDYLIYGGRGIKFLWTTYEQFKTDMWGEYVVHAREFGIKNTQIDRINVNGNYSKENCRWATSKEQGRNRRNNKKYLLKGQMHTISSLAELTGASRQAIRYRLLNGMTPHQAVSVPLNHGNKYASL